MKNAEFKEIKNLAEKKNWRFYRAEKGSHWKFFSPDGKTIILVGENNINSETKKKILNRFKKAGLWL